MQKLRKLLEASAYRGETFEAQMKDGLSKVGITVGTKQCKGAVFKSCQTLDGTLD